MEKTAERFRHPGGALQWPAGGLLLVAIGAGLALLLAAGGAVGAEPRVELELIAEEGLPPTAAHRWLSALQELRLASLRVRAGRPGDQIAVRQRGEGQGATYQVTGLLTADNFLELPGGRFAQHDLEGLRRWVGKLKEGGEAGLRETEAAFGLTPTQLVAVHEALSVPVSFATRGQRSFEVLKRISSGLSLSFLADAEARAAMAGEDLVLDELQGLTAGTAIAAILRPLGLVFAPQKQPGGEVRLWITDVRRAPQSWPVGWPSTRPPRETLPELFNFLNVEIEDTPLEDALAAIAERIKAPFLYDHNALARQRIVPADVQVGLAPERIYYQRIIARLLNQSGLTSDLRVDEVGTPFLWITTLRRSRASDP